MFIAIFGSIIIAWGDVQIAGKALYGDLLAILGAIFITAYFLFGQRVRKKSINDDLYLYRILYRGDYAYYV